MPTSLYSGCARQLENPVGMTPAAAEIRLGRQPELHLHCLVLDGVYRHTEGDPVFQHACAQSTGCITSFCQCVKLFDKMVLEQNVQ
jgi:hypothetical protein